MQRRSSQLLSRVAVALAAGLALLVVYQLYASGNAVLAAVCFGGFGLAFYIYTSSRTYSARYLFPGLTGIALFVVLPLAYTVWIGFTNYSSKNLLSRDRVTELLLAETYQDDATRYQFTLHRDGGGFRIVLRAGDDEAPPEEPAASMITPDVDAGTAPADAAAAIDAGTAAAPAPTAPPRAPRELVTPVVALTEQAATTVTAVPLAASGFVPGEPVPRREVIARTDALKALTVKLPDGTSTTMAGLREFTPSLRLYRANSDGTLTNQKTTEKLTPNLETGFYETPGGVQVTPGFRVSVGFDHYRNVLGDPKFQGPFLRVFAWTVVFAALTVVLTASLGMLLAELLSWEGLRFAGLYRVLLFLPYAVPGFISILVFKGLFNNQGDINRILGVILGIQPDWTTSPNLARVMILIVNTWLGYPYFMLLCMGLQKSISRELYEASALAGAGPLTNFFQITWPLIRKPLTPLLVSSFAFNFNNFVLIHLLTQGRPDFLDTSVPAGETDILVSYTYRIAFEGGAGQQFGLAAAISTIIFAMVALLSVVNLRLTKVNAPDKR
jgi:maltose/maltodextrin transport system permease protein